MTQAPSLPLDTEKASPDNGFVYCILGFNFLLGWEVCYLAGLVPNGICILLFMWYSNPLFDFIALKVRTNKLRHMNAIIKCFIKIVTLFD